MESTESNIGWLNKTNAAKYLNISRTTFLSWRQKDYIPSAIVNGTERFYKADLDEYMKKHRK